MKNLARIGYAALLVFAVGLLATWFIVPPPTPQFRGHPDSYWIDRLVYRDEAQVKQWREYGPDGVRVLVRALDGANRPGDTAYQKFHRMLRGILPAGLMSFLPAPPMDLTRSTRMEVVDLLSRLSKDATLALPSMARTLNDRDRAVRQIAITYFTAGEDENCLLNKMEAGAKAKLLPDFIRAAQDDNWGVRNNAMVALRFYPEQAPLVVPVLLKALGDSEPPVRNLAADALKRVDPVAAATAGVK